MSFNKYMLNRINERHESGLYRELSIYPSSSVDFSSNDYLGIAKSNSTGSTGSRLISGNSKKIVDLENTFSKLVGSEASLFLALDIKQTLG